MAQMRYCHDLSLEDCNRGHVVVTTRGPVHSQWDLTILNVDGSRCKAGQRVYHVKKIRGTMRLSRPSVMAKVLASWKHDCDSPSMFGRHPPGGPCKQAMGHTQMHRLCSLEASLQDLRELSKGPQPQVQRSSTTLRGSVLKPLPHPRDPAWLLFRPRLQQSCAVPRCRFGSHVISTQQLCRILTFSTPACAQLHRSTEALYFSALL